jgi:hypothetical protein
MKTGCVDIIYIGVSGRGGGVLGIQNAVNSNVKNSLESCLELQHCFIAHHVTLQLTCSAAVKVTMTPASASTATMLRTQYFKYTTMTVRRSYNLLSVLLLVLIIGLHLPSCLAQDNTNNDAATCSSNGASGSDGENNDGVCQGQSQSQSYEYESPNQQSPQQCTLYMAQSTIPHAGLGIFTGIPRAPGETLGSGDVLIPVIDLWYHLDAPMSEEHLDPTADYM